MKYFNFSLALNAKDFISANTIVMKFMTANLTNETRWIIGAKRLVEVYQRL